MKETLVKKKKKKKKHHTNTRTVQTHKYTSTFRWICLCVRHSWLVYEEAYGTVGVCRFKTDRLPVRVLFFLEVML